MAAQAKRSVTSKRTSSKQANSKSRNVSVKKLSERIVANNITLRKADMLLVKKKQAKTKSKESNGYLTLNGKLLSANDIGAKLRLAGAKVDSKKEETNKSTNRRNKSLTSKPKVTTSTNGKIKQKLSIQVPTRNQRKSNNARGNKLPGTSKNSKISVTNLVARKGVRSINPKSSRQITPKSRRRTDQPSKGRLIGNSNKGNAFFNAETKFNQLVINTDVDSNDKVLVFYNLTLGIKQDSLKKIIEKLSHIAVKKIRVKDLATGSATAHVWLTNSNLPDLEKVRTLFDSALVDGRTIQVLLSSDSTRSLMY